MEGQNHYIVLGIPVDASEAQIKSAYRAQMKKHHPDRNSGHPEATRNLQGNQQGVRESQ